MASKIKPGIVLYDMVEELESYTRKLVEEKGLEAGMCACGRADGPSATHSVPSVVPKRSRRILGVCARRHCVPHGLLAQLRGGSLDAQLWRQDGA